jgi:D,D-heptose 1,7-bisphosphate phosphatase
MKKIVFLDRDGTINVDTGYIFEIEKFQFEKNAVEGLKKLQEQGYEFIIVTNQSGIARGKYTEEDFWKFNDYVISELEKRGIKILDTYFSPYHPEKAAVEKYKRDTACRKPGTGMLEEALKKYRIDRKNSWMIGDKWADVKCGIDFGIKSILVRTGKGGKGDEKHKPECYTYIAEDLLDSANFIVENEASRELRETSKHWENKLK